MIVYNNKNSKILIRELKSYNEMKTYKIHGLWLRVVLQKRLSLSNCHGLDVHTMLIFIKYFKI